jgi:uncharacterized protein
MLLLSILSLIKLSTLALFSLIFITLFFIDSFSYFSLKAYIAKRNARTFFSLTFWIIAIIFYFFLIWAFFVHHWNKNLKDFSSVYYLSNLIIIVYIPKLLLCVIFLIYHLYCFIINIIGNTGKRITIKNITIFNLNISLSLLILLCLLQGYISGRFNYKITNHIIQFKDLPDSFNGIKIIQISDIHIGTYYKNEKRFEEVVNLVNKQNPDFIFFTGDLINNFSEEVIDFIPLFKKFHSRYGNYAVLGNHDYGDYFKWNTDREKKDNHETLLSFFPSMKFILLRNQYNIVKIGNDSITIAGVENWGHKPYQQFGDLEKTLRGLGKNNFVLLLSHDPLYWDDQIKFEKLVKMTFSGHTHGTQIGISLGNFEWSPLHYGFKLWGGLYKFNNRILYVNKGMGGGLYAGRIGISPEISVFVFKKAN